MDFEARKDTAKKLVVQFLGDYIPPRGLDSGSLANRIVQIADAFARRLPTKGDYAELIDQALNRIRETHESNTWPVLPAFIAAMPKSEKRGAAPETYRPDFFQMMASRMKNKEPVPERFLWSARIDVLLRDQMVDLQRVNEYRESSVASWREVYRHDAAERMAAKFGSQVLPFFSSDNAA